MHSFTRIIQRLRLINPHWPSYLNTVGIILGDLNICQPARPDYTRRDRLGWMWSFAFRRHAMYYLENKGSRWICFFQAEEERVQTQISQRLFDANNILCLQEVHGKDENIQAFQVLAPRFRFFWYFLSCERKRRRIRYLYSQGPSSCGGHCDTFGYLSRP